MGSSWFVRTERLSYLLNCLFSPLDHCLFYLIRGIASHWKPIVTHVLKRIKNKMSIGPADCATGKWGDTGDGGVLLCVTKFRGNGWFSWSAPSTTGQK
jgi:hypothetical protein